MSSDQGGDHLREAIREEKSVSVEAQENWKI
jgi:hypothetical protein